MAQLKPGTVVQALSGRDKNRLFCAVAVENEYVFIVDGKTRTLKRPKRKNPKHVKATNWVVATEQTTTNKGIRRALHALSER